MMSEKSGPLESGSHEARYVLIDDHGVQRGHADALAEARQKREGVDTERTVHVVREDRTVIPDAVHADTWGVADLALIHEKLTAAQAILTGEADELDARRVHPPEDAYLYDVAETLRWRGEQTREALETELRDELAVHEPPEPTDRDGRGDTVYETKTVRVHLPERGQFVYLMITRFDGEDHILGDIGYTSEYFQFDLMSQNNALRIGDTSPHNIAADHPFQGEGYHPPFSETPVMDLMCGLDTGPVAWEDLADGMELEPGDIAALTEDGDDSE